MNNFGPETIVRFECGKCEVVEYVTLGDLPTTPKGLFILPITVQCIQCLNIISCEVRDEDQKKYEKEINNGTRRLLI